MNKYDCIIPIGQTCNISFLLRNANLRKETSLFEWFVSNDLKDITKTLEKIYNKTDIIFGSEKRVYINDKNIFSGHYSIKKFKEIYFRRRNRLILKLKNNKKLLFIRVEDRNNFYKPLDITNFIKIIKKFNPNANIKLLLITNNKKPLNHPNLIKINNIIKNDPYCKKPKSNNFFITTLKNTIFS